MTAINRLSSAIPTSHRTSGITSLYVRERSMSALLCNAIADPRRDRETLALIRRRDIGGLWPASASCQAYGDRHLSDGSSTRYGEQLPVPRYPSEFALTPICEPDVRPDDKILDRPRDQDLAGSSESPYPSGDVDGEPCEIITSDSALAGVQPDDHPWRVDRPERGALPVRGLRTRVAGPTDRPPAPQPRPVRLAHRQPPGSRLRRPRAGPHQRRADPRLVRPDVGSHPRSCHLCLPALRAIFNTAVTDELVARNPCRIRGPAPTARRSARFRPSPRARPSCRRCRPSCEPPWCWRRGGLCGAARCSDCGGTTSTSAPARCEWSGRWGSGATAPSSWARRSRVPACGRCTCHRAPWRCSRTTCCPSWAPQSMRRCWSAAPGSRCAPRGSRRPGGPPGRKSGLPALRFHDLRHFAGTMAAAAGASTKEVMARGGWSSPQMALRYEHATKERDRFIAHALEAISQSVPEAANRPPITADDRGDRARARTQRARRQSDEEGETSETDSDQAVSPDRVRPSGFEPETCGLRVRCSAVELEAHRRV